MCFQITLSPSQYTDRAWIAYGSVNQTQPGGLRLPLRIRAHDEDSEGNARVVYRLLLPTLHHGDAISVSEFPFVVDSQSGEILVTRPMPPSREDFNFFVEACDQPEKGRPLCSEPVRVAIHLVPREFPWQINISCSSVVVTEVRFSVSRTYCKNNEYASMECFIADNL